MKTLVAIFSCLFLLYIGNHCVPGCEDETCPNSLKFVSTNPGIPTESDLYEGEPNNFFFQSAVINQTPYRLVDSEYAYDFSYIGTINNNTDEDWYALNLTADDFDRITPDTFANDNFYNCNADTSADGGCRDIGTIALTDEEGFHIPNGTADSVEQSFRGKVNKPYDPTGGSYDCNSTDSDCATYSFHKPRHTLEVTSLDGQPIDIKVEIYAPGLTSDKNGALTSKPIAVLQSQSTSDPDYPLEGPVDVSLANNQKVVFPDRVEHSVRVMDGSTEGVLNGLYFYHSCYCQSGLSDDALPRYNLVQFPYRLLIEKNMHQFRDQDPYGTGKYYIRISSNGRSTGKQYRLRWFWDNSFDNGKGGRLDASYYKNFLDEAPCPFDAEEPSFPAAVDSTNACFFCPNYSNSITAYRSYPEKYLQFACEYDAQALAMIMEADNFTPREIASAALSVDSTDELAGGYNTYWQDNYKQAGFKYNEPAQWDWPYSQTGTFEPFCRSAGSDYWCAGQDITAYEPYSSLIRYIPPSPGSFEGSFGVTCETDNPPPVCTP